MDTLAATCERVASHASRLKKVAALAEYFRTLSDDDLVRAVHFLSGRPFPASDDRRISAGWATMREAVLPVTGWDPYTLHVCAEVVGDPGETFALLLHARTAGEPLTLAGAEKYYSLLAAARKPSQKVEVFKKIFERHRPAALKYFIKIISGDLRIGLQEKMVEEALASSMDIPLAEIREASNRSGKLGMVALAARHGELHKIEAALFHPMDFMLAAPLDTPADLPDPQNWLIEDKFDGIRAQVHVAGGRVAIYTRGFGDVTAAFPEVVAVVSKLSASAVIDGEILGWRNGRALHFNMLQQRIARKKLDPALLEAVPAVLVGYDLLYLDGRLLFDMPIEARRELLESLQLPRVSELHSAGSREAIDTLFASARERGNEGLVLKRRGSLYEPGRRGGAWLKLKRPFGTLDVVITAAEHGSGKRATVLSDYTFAVRAGADFVNVGKAYSGLTDEEIRQLTRLLRTLTVDRFGRVLLVKPEVVLEVAFDAVGRSPRHKSGYALRFPRILRWRKDKKAGEIDSIERVRELYEKSIV